MGRGLQTSCGTCRGLELKVMGRLAGEVSALRLALLLEARPPSPRVRAIPWFLDWNAPHDIEYTSPAPTSS